MAGGVQEYCFAMPPSLGAESVRFLARQFADVLFEAGFTTVIPMKSYAEVENALLDGEAHAAWGPPIVCGRVERAGGLVALQSERAGSKTYRSALLTRASSGYKSLEALARTDVPVRAAWVDPWSMGGYVLPKHHVEASGYDPDKLFDSHLFLGSYEACVKALLGYDADITACFAGPRGLGHIEIADDRARELAVIAETDECPADAIVLSPKLPALETSTLAASLRALADSAEAMTILSMALDVDGLAPVAAEVYAALPFLGR
jgi:phosphonate transport system substrate-binding protein